MKKTILLSLLTVSAMFAQSEVNIVAKVTNFENEAINGEKIIFISRSSKKRMEMVSDAEGKFKLSLPAADTFDVKIERAGLENDYTYIAVPVVPEGYEMASLRLTIQISETGSFTMNDLKFETASAKINASSYEGLDKLVDYLKRKKDIKIEVSGHTDNEGNPQANQELSEKRAQAVKTYLVNKGISASRITTKGYGATQPIASNDTANGRAKNRRTEIKTYK